ncbi:TetR/AcrR family transcriptional regulator [Endozoicomonas sp. G2_1]|uniref:TetR/AcrR family transcriptional regulator n=1 Tax=Endozoicomonas sp. G2_1 TaxID=2821091 RepID=UPI001ADA314F|nr:TetR/AcrR family transcriptional regulator [Endozoicomonas sp. G2_1]MBO9490379.1 TetR/AcrR family transcriptional regulator [Endozoicomonas sp. G2_1]
MSETTSNSIKSALSERGILVLKAAQAMFLQHGYDATSLEMVIKESGGSRRTIYNEFGNKEGLFKAVILSKVEDVRLRLDDVSEDADIETTLIYVCRRFLSSILTPESLAMFRLLISKVDKLPDIGQSAYQAGPVTSVEPLAQYLESQRQKGLLSFDCADEAGRLLVGMVDNSMHIRAMIDLDYVPTEQEIDQQVTSAVKLFLSGALKR